MYARAANAYRTVDLESAPKPQVLDRLYGRLIGDLDTAAAAIRTRDIKAKANALDHASRIVTELIAALDHDAAPELCTHLVALYEFVQERISTASFRLDAGPLAQATEVLNHLRESFQLARSQP
jgi:flagellar secretion chaperone FliS